MNNGRFQRTVAEQLAQARAQRRQNLPADPEDMRERLRIAVLNFFMPIYSIFNEYRTTGVMVPGGDNVGEVFPDGNTIKTATESDRGRPMGVRYKLTPRYEILVTIATINTPQVPADLEMAKWRCRLMDHTTDPITEVTNELIGNVEVLAEWFAKTVCQFELDERRPQQTNPFAAILNAMPSSWQTLIEQERAAEARAAATSVELSSTQTAGDDPLHNRERVITLRDDNLTEETANNADSEP